jgi:hypothetical protein
MTVATAVRRLSFEFPPRLISIFDRDLSSRRRLIVDRGGNGVGEEVDGAFHVDAVYHLENC